MFTDEFWRLQAHYEGIYALCDERNIVFDQRIGTVGAVLEAWCEKKADFSSITSLFNSDSSSISSISVGDSILVTPIMPSPSIVWCLRTTILFPIKGIRALFRANLTSICDVEVWFCNSINDKRLTGCACVVMKDDSVRILLHPEVDDMEAGFVHECAHAYQLLRKNRTSELFATLCERGYIVIRAFLRLFRKKG